MSMKYCLIVAKGTHQGMPIPVTVDLFMIGSGKMCQMRTKVDGIGEQHCCLVVRDKKVFIRDLGSGFSTVVNTEVVPTGEEWPLHAGDMIEIGPLEFMIQFSEKALSQRDLEEWALRCLDQSHEEKRSAVEELDEVFNRTTDRYSNASAAADVIIAQLTAKRGLVKGRLRIGRDGDITHVRVNDAYLVEESELAFIKKELYDNLNAPHLKVLLDLKNVRRMSSMATEILSEFCRHLRRSGGKMAMCRLRPELSNTIQDLPSLREIPSFRDKEAALHAKW
jgi:anti-anti-sigma regulatory factor